MRKMLVLTTMIVLSGAASTWAQKNRTTIRESLRGVQEVPVVSSTGSGSFQAAISADGSEIAYTLSFENLEGDVRQAHIHIAPEQNTGAVVL